jgi:hypothetical protein
MTKLSKTRKSDREKMADAIYALAKEFNFDIEMIERDRCITIRINTEGGLGLMIDIDGTSSLNGFLGHWYITGPSTLSDAFEVVGERNKYHFAKATTFKTEFQEFLCFLRMGFEQVESGAAFQ